MTTKRTIACSAPLLLLFSACAEADPAATSAVVPGSVSSDDAASPVTLSLAPATRGVTILDVTGAARARFTSEGSITAAAADGDDIVLGTGGGRVVWRPVAPELA